MTRVAEVVLVEATPTSDQGTGLARTQAVGTCALPGGRSVTNATNPGAAVESSTLQEEEAPTQGVGAGVDGKLLFQEPKTWEFCGKSLFLSPKSPMGERLLSFS